MILHDGTHGCSIGTQSIGCGEPEAPEPAHSGSIHPSRVAPQARIRASSIGFITKPSPDARSARHPERKEKMGTGKRFTYAIGVLLIAGGVAFVGAAVMAHWPARPI